MKHYSKKKRNKLYVVMLDKLFNDSSYKVFNRYTSGLCYLSKAATGNYDDNQIRNFPELMKHKPQGKRATKDYWWTTSEEGSDRRICVLIEAIMRTL